MILPLLKVLSIIILTSLVVTIAFLGILYMTDTEEDIHNAHKE